MSGFDLEKVATSISNIFSEHLYDFIGILIYTRRTIGRLIVEGQNGIKSNIRHVISYSIINIFIGLCLGKFFKIENTPNVIDIQTIIGVLFYWVFSAIVLHLIIKIFRGDRNLIYTLIVSLYIISTIHVIFFPFFSAVVYFLSGTKVVLTYDYVVSYGLGFKGEIIGHKIETYIKDTEPKKETSILPPIKSIEEFKKEITKKGLNVSNHSIVELSKIDHNRVPIKENELKLPKREEFIAIKNWILFYIISMIYYFITIIYLSEGLSLVCNIRRGVLIVMAIFGPPVVAILIASLTLLALFLVDRALYNFKTRV